MPKRKLHDIVFGKAPEGKVIHHKNGDKLDCQKTNLEYETVQRNAQARAGARSDSKSGIRGVRQHVNGLWESRVTVDGKIVTRYSSTKEEASIKVGKMREDFGYLKLSLEAT